MRRFLHALLAISCALVASLVARAADARPLLDVSHVQGRDAPWIVGWNEAVVTLENKDLPAWRGEVIVDPSYDHRSLDRPSVRVPVTLAAGESARIVLPFYLAAGSWPTVILVSAAEDVGNLPLSLTHPIEGVNSIVEVQGALARGPRLVEVPTAGKPAFEEPSTGDDDEKKPPTLTIPTPGGSSYMPPPLVTTVQFARESGDPILPDIAPGWSGAVLVLIPSDVMVRLQGRQLDSLAQWILAGGTLAIEMVREEDLRAKNLTTLLGGDARLTGPSGLTQTFAGGNLQKGSAIGSGDEGDYAPYGLGDVWMLRRDPWARTPDPQSARDVYALWSRAKARRANLMSIPFGRGLQWIDDDRVRAFLDPNQGFRPALGIAALLVVVYAFLVGPIAFARARKLGKPLSVLRMTPLFALMLFAILVGIGKIGKGVRGRVRKLEMVDVAGGSTRGAVTAFHAFYVGDPTAIELSTTHPIDGVHMVEPNGEYAPIDLDRNAIVVRGVRSHPWQTVVIAEEGARDVEGGVVLEGSGVHLTLINNTPWTLEHVILHPEDPGVPARSRYFRTVGPGQTVVARDGLAVERRITPTALAGGDSPPPLSTQGTDRTKQIFDAIDAFVSVWFTYGAGTPIPLHVPMATAIAHIASPNESGFSVDDDVVFLRVIGLGGGKGKGQIDNPLEKKGSEGAL